MDSGTSSALERDPNLLHAASHWAVIGTAYDRRMDALIGLVGALIGAGAALAATYISGRRESREARTKEVRLAAAEHAKTLGSASHSVEWLTWKARFTPSGFSADNLKLYDQEMHAALGTLVGSLAVIAALDVGTYRTFQALTNELYELDWEVGQVAARFPQQPQDVIAELSIMFGRASVYNRQLNGSIADMFAN